MKIGFLITAYNCADFLSKSLQPFVNFCLKTDHKISVIHSVFQEYFDLGIPVLSADNTHEDLNDWFKHGLIDGLTISDRPLNEAAARNLALKQLLNFNCDVIFLVDAADELFTLEQIDSIVKYVENHPDVSVFQISYKNYFQTEDQYLETPFTPNRIWRVNVPPFKLDQFNWDNDCIYSYSSGQVSDKNLKNKLIPSSIAHIKHFSWINGQRSLIKKNYQIKHFGGICSYDVSGDGLVTFSETYYKNKPKPKILKDE